LVNIVSHFVVIDFVVLVFFILLLFCSFVVFFSFFVLFLSFVFFLSQGFRCVCYGVLVVPFFAGIVFGLITVTHFFVSVVVFTVSPFFFLF